MDLKSPSAEDVGRVLDVYQRQVRTGLSTYDDLRAGQICPALSSRFRDVHLSIMFVSSSQSSLDAEKPFVLDKHMSDIDR